MIKNAFIINEILPALPKGSRVLDTLLIEQLMRHKDKQIIKELRNYQNNDGGFGHGLEPDIQMSSSYIAACNIAAEILDFLPQSLPRDHLIKELVGFYEQSFIESKNGWDIVPKEVNNYPRAIWWNYEDVASFTYGNPNPEIVGFLFQYRSYLNKLNINSLIKSIVDYIRSSFLDEYSMHSLLSVLRFYKYMDTDVEELIRDTLQQAVDKELTTSKEAYDEYNLKPHNIVIYTRDFLQTHQDYLETDLKRLKETILTKHVLFPQWKWMRYETEFTKAKNQWSGFLTFNALRALRYKREKTI